MKRPALLLLLLGLLWSLAACAAGDGVPGWARFSGPPPAAARVVVEPVDGTFLPLGRLLARSVAEELGILGIRAAAADKPGGAPDGFYVIRGRAQHLDKEPLDKAGGPLALIHWTLFDAQGRAMGAHTEPVRGTRTQWEYGDPRLLHAIGEATAEALEPLISSP